MRMRTAEWKFVIGCVLILLGIIIWLRGEWGWSGMLIGYGLALLFHSKRIDSDDPVRENKVLHPWNQTGLAVSLHTIPLLIIYFITLIPIYYGILYLLIRWHGSLFLDSFPPVFITERYRNLIVGLFTGSFFLTLPKSYLYLAIDSLVKSIKGAK